VRALTPAPHEPEALRYADFALSPDGASVFCVRERHDDDRITRSIVVVPLDGSGVVREIVSGADFFGFPTPSPDGTRIAFVCWNHPNMPWDGTELRVADLDGGLGTVVMGGQAESVLAPVWCGDALYAVSDRSGWWNLYRVDPNGRARALCPRAEEFAEPLWELGDRTFAVLPDGRLAVLHGRGDLRLGVLDPDTGILTDVPTPYTSFLPTLSVDGTVVACIAGAPDRPLAVVRIDVATGVTECLRAELDELPDAAYLPRPRRLELDGIGGHTVHALAYPPSSPVARGPEGELPPYVVWAHGGPTGHEVGLADLTKAFFTSRGIGVLDVNYGGSSGYGRGYRERLNGQWGVVDVADVVAAARSLVQRGMADARRLAIRGPSAGGSTALGAVTTGVAAYGPTFAAAVSYFGIADFESLVAFTHDFESHYLDGLLGPLPECVETYRARSAIGHVSPGTCPVLLLQGKEDPVVSPAQADAMVRDLDVNGIAYEHLVFDGEGHGFRRAETITACLEAELRFYRTHLVF
jgi:dipeptidyl aminopeptidase/acylaminoacyl peptidase